jgi:lambda repressor-like predicted transcriptional regulator
MKLALTVRTSRTTRAFVESAVAGLVATTPEAEELVAALLDVLDDREVGAAPREPVSPADVAAVHRDLGGSVAATARALGVARSTVRAKLAALGAAAANDNGREARRTG